MIHSKTLSIIQELRIPNPHLYESIDGMGIFNTAIVERTERPIEGGILVYLYGYKYPYKGIPDQDSFHGMHNLKRAIAYAISNFNGWQIKALVVSILISPGFFKNKIIDSFFNYIYTLERFYLEKVFLRDDRYCASCRELKRTFDKLLETKIGRTKTILFLLRDIGVNILEIDCAYRFRWQDIMNEVNKEEITKTDSSQIKEIKRLSDILVSRERDENHMRARWRNITRLLTIWLYISKKTRKVVAEFFQELNLDKVKPDAGDDYFNGLRQDYKFKGKTLIERVEERKIMDGKNWHFFEDLAASFIQEAKEKAKVMK